jgi:hypothetical protein
MSTTFLTFYLLLWPLIVAGVLAVIARAFMREMRVAQKTGRSMI